MDQQPKSVIGQDEIHQLLKLVEKEVNDYQQSYLTTTPGINEIRNWFEKNAPEYFS
jgi:hypothetical protein